VTHVTDLNSTNIGELAHRKSAPLSLSGKSKGLIKRERKEESIETESVKTMGAVEANRISESKQKQ
jgi:hypothetical protein